jgi:hypothetical protein
MDFTIIFIDPLQNFKSFSAFSTLILVDRHSILLTFLKQWFFHIQDFQGTLACKEFDNLSHGICISFEHQLAVFEGASG